MKGDFYLRILEIYLKFWTIYDINVCGQAFLLLQQQFPDQFDVGEDMFLAVISDIHVRPAS